MGHRFAEIAFTPDVQAVQQAQGSRAHYARLEGGEPYNDELGAEETRFIAARDSLYMASTSATGWPYVQHRGGPAGFIRVLDSSTIGFADYRGNRQYVSTGNLLHDGRVALILVDYPRRARLKLLGKARLVTADEPDLYARLQTPGYKARAERAYLIRVVAFDWNCPQHITPRYTESELDARMAPLKARIAELESRL
jgi:predicted pyridoxine 5'-phosphate oxidase superfamily flavin-nucleotide-binding protein